VSAREFVLDTSALLGLGSLDLGAYAAGTALLSAVTIGELAFGLGVGAPEQQAARAALFRRALARFEILPFDVEEAKLYGALAALVRAAGRSPRPRRLDLQIAATAAAARMPLLTCNPADFVGLERLVDVVPVQPVSRRC
jgi:predicted nucleic acid-binding protein